MALTTPTPAGSQDESSAPDFDSISEKMQQVRAAASALLNKADGASSITEMATAVEKAAGALKLAEEMRKAHTELMKVNEEISKLEHENATAAKRERSERIRDYVAMLTPLVAILTLATTIFAQSWQFLRSERTKHADALQAQWQDAVKTISASGALSPGVTALQPFLRIPEYSEQARELALNLLANSSDPAFFTSLFGTAFTPVTWDNMKYVIRLDRALLARGDPLWKKTWDPVRRINDPSRLVAKDELATHTYVNVVLPAITAQIGGVLKRPRPAGTPVDLTATAFIFGNWQGINLGEVNLENSYLAGMTLKDAELEGLQQFANVSVFATAWWEAKSINKPLLEYLKNKYPFVAGDTYGARGETSTQQEYDAAIRRLTSQPK